MEQKYISTMEEMLVGAIEDRKALILAQIQKIRKLAPLSEKDGGAVARHMAEIARHMEHLISEMRRETTAFHQNMILLGIMPEEIPYTGFPGFDLQVEGSVIKIMFDAMLPYPSKGYVHYLHVGLEYQLSYMAKTGLLPRIKECCAVVFLHHYNNSTGALAHLRDYDNLERRCVLNVLARHFLLGDSPYSIISMDVLAPGDHNFTEVRLCPIAEFRAFVMSEDIEYIPNVEFATTDPKSR